MERFRHSFLVHESSKNLPSGKGKKIHEEIHCTKIPVQGNFGYRKKLRTGDCVFRIKISPVLGGGEFAVLNIALKYSKKFQK